MKTTQLLIIKDIQEDFEKIKIAAGMIRSGGLVAIPTETVYGLGANALDPQAVKGIFEAKGRPQDNPLIIHIACTQDAQKYAKNIPDSFYRLAQQFWPGPLTMIVPKRDCIPIETSGGLQTVAIRQPSHPVARAIIQQAGVPIAAPSANLSGKPSGTTAAHCMADFDGKIDAVVDAGSCQFGVESTVLSLAGDVPELLRPGAVTPEQIRSVVGELKINPAVVSRLEEGAVAASPGMKYKHYSPKATVIILDGDREDYLRFVNGQDQEGVFALCFEEDIADLKKPFVVYGRQNDDLTQARELFYALRELDQRGAQVVYARCPSKVGVGLAVYNRLLRAAGFEVKKI